LSGLQREKIWDPVSRLWHWAFAAAVIANWLLGTYMSFDTVQWHFYVGYVVLGLVVLRVLWGLVGPAPVRFRTFAPSPSAIAGYLKTVMRREPGGAPGHNPLGALSVFALLLVIAAQAGSGLFLESEDFFEEALLHDYVSDDVADFMSSVHHTLSDVVLILVGLHVAAVLFYLVWKRENLITAMIHGWKWVRRG